MKKRKKKYIKKRKQKRKVKSKKKIKSRSKPKRKKISFPKKRKKGNKKKTRKKFLSKKKSSTKETFRKILRVSDKLSFKITVNFNLDRALQKFFQNISNKIQLFKQVIEEERDRKKAEKIRAMQRETDLKLKESRLLKLQELKQVQQRLKEEQKLQKERKLEIKRFIREEQAVVRKEQADRQKKFYEKIKLEKKIEQFRKREEIEIKNLEKYVLKQERENYSEVEQRIENIKLKYQAIRDQKIRERIEQLGIEVSDNDTRSDLLEKEKQFNEAREKIEYTLESFYRSMTSCIFQLNRRWLPKKMSLLRVIDRRYETSEIFIKLDEESDENWIMLVYLKDNNPNSDIVVEDKTDSEKNYSLEYKTNEIFKFSDKLVDSLTNMIDKEYKKKIS